MTDSSDDVLRIIQRRAVRLVVVDAGGRVLLLHIREPLHPEQDACWELPGGGINADETVSHAARRELIEETGIEVDSGTVRPPSWRRTVTFRHAGTRRLQPEVVVQITIDVLAPAVDQGGQLADEIDTYLGHRWWTVHEVETSTDRFYPARLPLLLGRFLNGEEIDEPFEYFS